MFGIVGKEAFLITVFEVLAEGLDQGQWGDLDVFFFLDGYESLDAVVEIEENLIHGLVLLCATEFGLE